MAWALALVVAIGAGLPVAAWSISRRLPPPNPARRPGRGYDAIDRWLADRHQLAWRDRSRVRTAVFQGRQVEEPHLAPAASTEHAAQPFLLTTRQGTFASGPLVGKK